MHKIGHLNHTVHTSLMDNLFGFCLLEQMEELEFFLPVLSMKNVIKFIWILIVGPDGIAGICFPVISIKKLSN